MLKSLANGANLMEPGVIRSGNDLKSYGNFKRDQIVAVNLTSNASAVAVGSLERDSMDMYMSGGRGICVKVIHVFGDKLWGIEPQVIKQIPVSQAVVKAPNLKNDDDFPALGAEPVKKPESKETESQPNAQVEAVEDTPKSPDELLKNSFMRSLKNNKKELLTKLPLIVAIFYPTYVLKQAEVDNNSITIKDTTFKKVSTFMKKMSEEGFVVIREESKGVEKIHSINFDHPELATVAVTRTKAVVEENHNLILTKMTELYLVNDETKGIFSKVGVKEGDSLDSTQIKNYVKDYTAREKLIDNQTKRVTLNPILKEICGIPEEVQEPSSIDLDQLIRTVTQKMTETFEMRSSTAPQMKGGKKPIIQISTATRSGNKKVTMIRNLDSYGINMAEFSKTCKIGAQASVSITKIPGTNLDQFQIQGNHVKFIYDLLAEKFGVAKGNISGLEFAKKDKTKKK